MATHANIILLGRLRVPSLVATVSLAYASAVMAGDNVSDALQMARRIDAIVQANWEQEGIAPADRSDDSEFLRRVSLDITGVIPTVGTVREFLEDDRDDKRKRLIDRLIASPRHAAHLADVWRRMLLPQGIEPNQWQDAARLQRWLRDQFADNHRYDRLVADFLLASGPTASGPALFYRANEFQPEKLAAHTSQVFLGLRLQCAQCHDHPFNEWTQRDFWGYAAFFAQLKRPQAGVMSDRQSLGDVSFGEVTLPDTETVVAPKYPRGEFARTDEGGTRRMQLAIWMASRENPYLPRRAVNWAWAHMFGRGLVEPVDDLGKHNPPDQPALFDELTTFFVDSGYDLHQLFRALANSQVYQLTSRASDKASSMTRNLAAMPAKTLTSEQLYDSLRQNVIPGLDEAASMAELSSELVDPRRMLFAVRTGSESDAATQYGRGVIQTLVLMNGPEMQVATDLARSPLLRALEAPIFTDEERINVLFLATLSRYPRSEERGWFIDFDEQRRSMNAEMSHADILWALLNSSEFSLNH